MFRKLLGVLLVLVTLGCIVSPAMAKSTNLVSAEKLWTKETKSPNDEFNLWKIREIVETHSREEIEKKYREAVKKSNQQYMKMLQEIDEIKKNWKYTNDDEKEIIGVGSYYHRDDTADGGISAHGGSGIGYSDAWTDGNEIHVWSIAEGYGDYWAHGRV